MKSTDRARRNRLIELIGQEKYDFLMLINPFGEDGLTIPKACEQIGISERTGQRWLDEITQKIPGIKDTIKKRQQLNSQMDQMDQRIKSAENNVGIEINYTPGVSSLNSINEKQIKRLF